MSVPSIHLAVFITKVSPLKIYKAYCMILLIFYHSILYNFACYHIKRSLCRKRKKTCGVRTFTKFFLRKRRSTGFLLSM